MGNKTSSLDKIVASAGSEPLREVYASYMKEHGSATAMLGTIRPGVYADADAKKSSIKLQIAKLKTQYEVLQRYLEGLAAGKVDQKTKAELFNMYSGVLNDLTTLLKAIKTPKLNAESAAVSKLPVPGPNGTIIQANPNSALSAKLSGFAARVKNLGKPGSGQAGGRSRRRKSRKNRRSRKAVRA